MTKPLILLAETTVKYTYVKYVFLTEGRQNGLFFRFCASSLLLYRCHPALSVVHFSFLILTTLSRTNLKSIQTRLSVTSCKVKSMPWLVLLPTNRIAFQRFSDQHHCMGEMASFCNINNLQSTRYINFTCFLGL